MEKTLAELLADKSDSRLPVQDLIARFKGDEVNARNLIDLQKRVIDENHNVLPLPFVQTMEEIEAKVREKLDSQK